MLWSFIVLLIIAILLEGTITTIPLVLICLLCFAIVKKDINIFFIAFFAGLFFDILGIRPIGVTSIFFLIFLLLVFLYQRKYEIESYPFVIIASFMGSIVFLTIFGYRDTLLTSGLSAVIAMVLFGILQFFTGGVDYKKTTPVVAAKKGFQMGDRRRR